MKNLSSKVKVNLIRNFVVYFAFLFVGAMLITYHNKMEGIQSLQKSMENRLREIETMEKRIGELHERLSGTQQSRRKRSIVEHNQTQSEEKGIENDLKEGEPDSRPSCNIKCGGTAAGGAVYTRWGRKTCSNESELIYEGIVGGSFYDHVGAAVNPLCLPTNPLWNRFDDNINNHAFMYGTEYESTFLHALFSLSHSRNLHNENVPCALCRSKARLSVVMVPARNVCYPGWTLEYHGYLMAGHNAQKGGSMYICVDEAPEVTESGFRDENGYLLYSVEAQCGSLPCPEYVQGRELTCAVCSK